MELSLFKIQLFALDMVDLVPMRRTSISPQFNLRKLAVKQHFVSARQSEREEGERGAVDLEDRWSGVSST